MEDVFAILPTGFWKEFNLSTLSTSYFFTECKSSHHLHDHGGLSSTPGDNEWGWRTYTTPTMTYVHLPFCFQSIDLSLCRVWQFFDLPCSVYTLFRLVSIARYLLKSPSVGFWGRKFEIFQNMLLTCIQNKVDNWKPQAVGHVTGPSSRSISGRKDLLLSLPTGVLLLPLIVLFYFFLHRFLRCTPTNWTLGRVCWTGCIFKIINNIVLHDSHPHLFFLSNQYLYRNVKLMESFQEGIHS